MEKVRDFCAKFNNNFSAMSLVAMGIGLLGVAAGHYFCLVMHAPDPVYYYFGGCAGLILVYAVCYGFVAQHATEFDGGLVRARLVMPVLALASGLSFLYRGLLTPFDPAHGDKIFLLGGGPAVMLIFAFTFGNYVKIVENDRLPEPAATSAKRRGGPGRFTLSLLKWATLVAIIASAVSVACQKDAYALWAYFVALVIAFVVCGAVEFGFAGWVTVEEDRGYS